MSKFFLDIRDVFKNQSKEKDFEKDKKFLKDKLFFFKTDNLGENNCMLTTDKEIYNPIEGKTINKTRDLVYDLINESFLLKWKKNKYQFKNEKFDNSISNLKKIYSLYKPNEPNISDSDVKKNFEENKSFKKFCFVNKYIDENDRKTHLKFFNEVLEYKSLRQIKRKVAIFKNELNCNLLKQQSFGDCYFLEALSVLSNYGQLIYQLFPNEQMPKDGIFTVCLFVNGKWRKIYIDDYFFFFKDTEEFAFVEPIDNCIYSCILEKAYAKINGSFPAIVGGFCKDAFKALTGFDSLEINIDKDSDDDKGLLEFIKEKLEKGYLFSCCTQTHAFSLHNIFLKEKQSEAILQVRNPWGDDYNDDESAKANEILSMNSEKFNKIMKNNNNGIFQLTYPEFKTKFTDITVCQTMFNSTIYSYTIGFKNIKNSKIYFKLNALEETEFGISIYQNNTISYQVSYKPIDNPEQKYIPITISNNIKEAISFKSKNFEKKNYEFFHFVKLGEYVILIEREDRGVKTDSTIIVTLIIKGQNCTSYYMGEDENGDNLNLNKDLFASKYVYGEKTGILFEAFRELKNFIEEYHKITVTENCKGYYIETIFTDEIKTLIFTEKKNLETFIGSIEKGNDSVLFTGKNHVKGKICGKGAIKNLKTNKITELILKDNKIFSFCLDINDKSDTKELLMTLQSNHSIVHKQGEYSINFYMDKDKLYLKKNEIDWTCSFCKQSFDKELHFFYCHICNFYLCLNCLSRYDKIIFDIIEEVHIGFEQKYYGQGGLNFLLAIPRFVLPMNPLTHKTHILASLYLKTVSNIGVVIEFGDFKGQPIKVKDKEYLTYYWTNKENGIRFTEMTYEEYKEKKLDYAKESNRIFKLYPQKVINLKDALLLCNNAENGKKWNSTNYNQFFNNSKDFVANFIRITESIRGKGESLRGAHNSSSVVIPKVILDEIEANEKDNVQNFFGKVPLVGYLVDAFSLGSNIKNYVSSKK